MGKRTLYLFAMCAVAAVIAPAVAQGIVITPPDSDYDTWIRQTGRGFGKVTGVVTYKGKPLEGASEMFIAKNARPAQGTTDASGRYELTTIDSGDGATAGEHAVIISKTEIVPTNERSRSEWKGREGEGYEQTRETLPEKYTQLMKTPLKATVEADGRNSFAFELKD